MLEIATIRPSRTSVAFTSMACVALRRSCRSPRGPTQNRRSGGAPWASSAFHRDELAHEPDQCFVAELTVLLRFGEEGAPPVERGCRLPGGRGGVLDRLDQFSAELGEDAMQFRQSAEHREVVRPSLRDAREMDRATLGVRPRRFAGVQRDE